MTRSRRLPNEPVWLTIPALAALWAAGPAEAQAPRVEDTATAREDTAEDLSREINRILYLANGDTVRAKCRFVDGRWEYRRDRAWQVLPEGFVVDTAREKDLVREAERRSKAVGDEDLAGRVELARWMIGAGLRKESLAELDRVLDRSPHDEAALALLTEERFLAVPSVDVPGEEVQEAMVALFDWAIAMPRAAQELAILEFAKVREREGLGDDFAKALGSHSAARRAFAARLLGRLYPGEHLEELLAHAVLDASPEARRGSAEAVGALGEPGLVAPLVRALETSGHPIVRQNAAESLGYMGYASAVPALVNHLATTTTQARGASGITHGYVFFGRQFAYIQDFDVEVAQFQSIADPQVNVLIEGAVQQSGVVSARREVTVVERATVRNALSRLTGETPGRNSAAWLDWWEENKDSWKDRGSARPARPESPR